MVQEAATLPVFRTRTEATYPWPQPDPTRTVAEKAGERRGWAERRDGVGDREGDGDRDAEDLTVEGAADTDGGAGATDGEIGTRGIDGSTTVG